MAVFCQWLVCCVFSEGEQLLVSTEVSHHVGHPEGQEGVSPTGVHD